MILNMEKIVLKYIKMHFLSGSRILIVDDLIATGGTAIAAISLVEQLGGIVSELAFIIDLPDLGGSKKITHRWLQNTLSNSI